MTATVSVEAGAARMRNGGVVAYPAEAVFVLGCDPFDRAAIERLLSIRQHPGGHDLVLLAASYELLEPLLESRRLPRERLELVLESWPGPHTWRMPCLAAIPAWLRGADATLSVRVSAHPVAAALSAAFGGPIVCTAASIADAIAPATRDALAPTLLEGIDGVVGGETGPHAATVTLRDAATGALLGA